MRKGLLSAIAVCIALFGVVQAQSILKEARTETILRMDADNTNDVLPRNFRMVPAIHASGSAQFSEKNAQNIASTLKGKKVIVIDLRQETHGFVNGIAMSWYGARNWANVGKTTDEVVSLETSALSGVIQTNELILHTSLKKNPVTGILDASNTIKITPQTVMSEEQMLKNWAIGYYRIAVTDHCRPTDSNVDTFITFIRKLPQDTWLHFHCEAGHGRTTSFMAMYDMMQNARNLAFADIINRQHGSGGSDLFAGEKGWQDKYAKERLAFLKLFYEYCRQNNDGYRTSWTAWFKTQEIKVAN